MQRKTNAKNAIVCGNFGRPLCTMNLQKFDPRNGKAPGAPLYLLLRSTHQKDAASIPAAPNFNFNLKT